MVDILLTIRAVEDLFCNDHHYYSTLLFESSRILPSVTHLSTVLTQEMRRNEVCQALVAAHLLRIRFAGRVEGMWLKSVMKSTKG